MKKNGFTLIELLATLMLLAIISMITVPSIMNVISDIRAKAFERSVEGLIRTIYDDSASTKFSSGSYRIFDGSMRYNNRVIETKGDVLGNGTIIIDDDGDIKLGIVYNEICASKDYSDVKVIYSNSDCDIPIIPSIIDYSFMDDFALNTNLNTAMFSSYQYQPYVFGANNQLVIDTNPWGDKDIIWRGSDDSTTTTDGGFFFGYLNNSRIPINNLKTYRFSVWLKKNNTAGSVGLRDMCPFATQTSSNETTYYVDGTGGTLYPTISTTTINQWQLLVYYLYPYNVTEPAGNVDTIYNANGTVAATSKARKMNSTSKFMRYYAGSYTTTSTTGYAYFYRPRMDIIDGNEPTIADLLSGQENSNLYND